MANTFPWEQFDKITFERGLCIKRNMTGQWHYVNMEVPLSVSDPNTIMTSLGIRPVLAERSNESPRVSFILPALRGRLLDLYKNELDLPEPLKYLMGSMLFHCSALARNYAEECAGFVDQLSTKSSAEEIRLRGKETIATRVEEPFYGFETLITKIIIGYESIRYSIWKKYESEGKPTPPTFIDTVKTGRFPSDIAKRIQLSTLNCYLPAKKFRKCIQNHVDIGSSSWCVFEKKSQSLWLFKVRLPDNPEAKSVNAFTFDQGHDALTTAWEYVSEFFALTDIILGKGKLSSA